MKIIITLLLNIFTLWVVSFVVPGFYFEDTNSLIVAAVAIGVVNTFIKPILQILFLPLSLLTFGVTAFLINVVLLWGVSFIVPGFTIENFMTAVIGSLLLSLVTMFLHKLGEDKNH